MQAKSQKAINNNRFVSKLQSSAMERKCQLMIRNNVHTFRLNGLNDGYLKMRMEWNFVIVKNYLVGVQRQIPNQNRLAKPNILSMCPSNNNFQTKNEPNE